MHIIQTGQQLIGVRSDLEVVHRDFALFYQRIRTPAATINHLLVGQYGLIDRIPVNGTDFLVNDAFFVQLREQPLLPTVIVRLAGGNLARPINRQTQLSELCLHIGHVLVSPSGWRNFMLDRCVFSGHAERIPTHGLQHVFTEHTLVAGNHITDGVVAHVTHMQTSAGVGEHRQAIEGVFACLLGHFKGFLLSPVALSGGFNVARLILFVHDFMCLSSRKSEEGCTAAQP